MKLSNIVPWGRSFDEYQSMFVLTTEDLHGRVLGCGDGPASFNAEATLAGARVVSVDPIYAYSAAEIERRVNQTFETIISQARELADRYIWKRFSSVEALGVARLNVMQSFLDDYESGRQAGRYIEGLLPNLPFSDDSFDIALCSHLLFLYSTHLSLDEHVAAARELLRVAREVRIFPIISLTGEPSPHLVPVCEALRGDGHTVKQQIVSYEFQRGGNTMLRLTRGAVDGAITPLSASRQN